MSAASPPPAPGYPASYYAATARGLEAMTPLDGDTTADVCVIGGGYTGLSAALYLAEQGRDVVLLEARRVGWGASGRNGGQVGSGQRLDEAELEARCGAEVARRLWELAESAKQRVRDRIARHAIDCEFAPGQLVLAATRADEAGLYARADHLRRRYGYDAIECLSAAEARERCAAAGLRGGFVDHGAFHLHPLNYALGLARAARAAGVRVCEDSPARGWDGDGPVRVRTPTGEVRASCLVIACNGYLDRLAPRLAGLIMPINSYMVATAPLGEDGARALIRDNVCVHDMRFIVSYFRRSADHRLLFGGGESYRRAFPADIAGFVRPHLLRVFPQLGQQAIDYAWGGTLAITLNRLPQLGRLGPAVCYAQGFSGHGLAIGTLAGEVIAAALTGSARDFETLAALPAHRFPGGALLRFPMLVLGMAWYALRDRLAERLDR